LCRYVTKQYSIGKDPKYSFKIPLTMSPSLTIPALAALVIALLLLLVYFRMEAREIVRNPDRHPLFGRYFIAILLICTFSGMAITEWLGVCSLSPWGFITGLLLGSAADFAAYRNRKRG
jgi:O-antigen ligase